jgi:hypothetical protein
MEISSRDSQRKRKENDFRSGRPPIYVNFEAIIWPTNNNNSTILYHDGITVRFCTKTTMFAYWVGHMGRRQPTASLFCKPYQNWIKQTR